MSLGTLAAADDRVAIVEPGHGRLTYAELDHLADVAAARFRALGIAPGDRIGLALRRSADAIAAMLGALRAGAAYVPLDPRAPVERNVDAWLDCGVRVVLVEQEAETAIRAAVTARGGQLSVHGVGECGGGTALQAWAAAGAAGALPPRTIVAPDLAYILYTSGSTGLPKGVVMSRGAVESFVDWTRRFLQPTRDDVFGSHAQFNFAISVFDIYTSLASGAALAIVPDEIRLFAPRVAELFETERVTIWFSGAAILMQLSGLELGDRLASLRILGFAGEPFPVTRLRALRRHVPRTRTFNFWGSTETNIGVHHELPVGVDLEDTPPIGRPCDHFEARVIVPDDGSPAPVGTPGELQLRGPALMSGYWNQPSLTADKLVDAADGRGRWYRTGDMVTTLPSGDLRYVGRLGRMVKLRGYRVEPGEVEACLYGHPEVKEAAVVPRDGREGLELVGHLATTSGAPLSAIKLREFCARRLPAYMIPAAFVFHDALPRTSSGKIDLRAL